MILAKLQSYILFIFFKFKICFKLHYQEANCASIFSFNIIKSFCENSRSSSLSWGRASWKRATWPFLWSLRHYYGFVHESCKNKGPVWTPSIPSTICHSIFQSVLEAVPRHGLQFCGFLVIMTDEGTTAESRDHVWFVLSQLLHHVDIKARSQWSRVVLSLIATCVAGRYFDLNSDGLDLDWLQ